MHTVQISSHTSTNETLTQTLSFLFSYSHSNDTNSFEQNLTDSSCLLWVFKMTSKSDSKWWTTTKRQQILKSMFLNTRALLVYQQIHNYKYIAICSYLWYAFLRQNGIDSFWILWPAPRTHVQQKILFSSVHSQIPVEFSYPSLRKEVNIRTRPYVMTLTSFSLLH